MAVAVRHRRRYTRRVLLALQWYDRRLHEGVARYGHEHGWRVDASMTVFPRVDHAWRGDGILARVFGDDDVLALVKELNK